MFRVPISADNPTFDYSERVGFVRWLKSSKAEREEWARRRNLAATKARLGQNTRLDEWTERKRAEHEERKAR